MSKIDYTKIITSNDLKQISTEEYQNAVNIGEMEALKQAASAWTGRTVRKGVFFGGNIVSKEHIAKEISTIKCRDLNAAERSVVACSFLFNTESFIRVLIENGYDFITIFQYGRLIRSTKEFLLKTKQEAANQNIIVANKQLEKLCKIFSVYYGVQDYNLILSKLCQVAWFEKNLYNSTKEKIHKRSR